MMATAQPVTHVRCRPCGIKLNPRHPIRRDDVTLGVCGDCKDRPEGRRLMMAESDTGRPRREFTAAERGLIRALHGYLPAGDLLRLLNERLVADLGSKAAPYTMEQLHVEAAKETATDTADWAGLRRLLAQARRSGLLAKLTAQTVEDFAIVFQLTTAQATHLRDVILNAKEPR